MHTQHESNWCYFCWWHHRTLAHGSSGFELSCTRSSADLLQNETVGVSGPRNLVSTCTSRKHNSPWRAAILPRSNTTVTWSWIINNHGLSTSKMCMNLFFYSMIGVAPTVLATSTGCSQGNLYLAFRPRMQYASHVEWSSRTYARSPKHYKTHLPRDISGIHLRPLHSRPVWLSFSGYAAALEWDQVLHQRI